LKVVKKHRPLSAFQLFLKRLKLLLEVLFTLFLVLGALPVFACYLLIYKLPFGLFKLIYDKTAHDHHEADTFSLLFFGHELIIDEGYDLEHSLVKIKSPHFNKLDGLTIADAYLITDERFWLIIFDNNSYFLNCFNALDNELIMLETFAKIDNIQFKQLSNKVQITVQEGKQLFTITIDY
jgi:hypothetical protein